MRTTIVLAAACTLIGFGLSGCDDSVYENAHVPAPETQPAERQKTGVPSGTSPGGTSVYGSATGAAHRTADRIDQQQDRILDEIPD